MSTLGSRQLHKLPRAQPAAQCTAQQAGVCKQTSPSNSLLRVSLVMFGMPRSSSAPCKETDIAMGSLTSTFASAGSCAYSGVKVVVPLCR